MCMQKAGPVQNQNLTVASATVTYVTATGWLPAMGYQNVKALLELIDKSGNFSVSVGFQTAATDPTSPDSWAGLETTPNYLLAIGAKDCTAVVDLTSTLDSKFWIRFGYAIKNSSGTSLTRGDVRLTVVGTN